MYFRETILLSIKVSVANNNFFEKLSTYFIETNNCINLIVENIQ